MSGERYDLHAKLPDGATHARAPEMLQRLLAERFRLVFHWGRKERPVYALEVGKSGLKISEAGPGPDPVSGSGGQPGIVKGLSLHLDRMMTMPGLCDYLARFVDRPLIDATGLKAAYRVVLDVPLLKSKQSADAAAAAHASAPGDAASDPANLSLAAELLRQLGLRLEPRRAPVDVLVVDHADKAPSEN